MGSGAQDTACASAFIERFGRRAYRRPLTDAEKLRYERLVDAHGSVFANGVRLIVTTMLSSVHFVYHMELPASPDAEVAHTPRPRGRTPRLLPPRRRR